MLWVVKAMTFQELEPHQDIPFSQLCWALGKWEMREGGGSLTIPYGTRSHHCAHPALAAALHFSFSSLNSGGRRVGGEGNEQNGVKNYYHDAWSSASW